MYRKDVGVSLVHANLQLFLLWDISKEGLRSRVYKRNKEGQSQGRAGAAVFVALSNDNRRRTAANLSPSCARALSWEMGDRSGRYLQPFHEGSRES